MTPEVREKLRKTMGRLVEDAAMTPEERDGWRELAGLLGLRYYQVGVDSIDDICPGLTVTVRTVVHDSMVPHRLEVFDPACAFLIEDWRHRTMSQFSAMPCAPSQCYAPDFALKTSALQVGDVLSLIVTNRGPCWSRFSGVVYGLELDAARRLAEWAQAAP
jgi:hypothetical protein